MILIRLHFHFDFGVTQLQQELGSQETRYTEKNIVIMSESHIWIVTSIQRQAEKSDSYTIVMYSRK
jgi:hypothetical protein